MIDMPTFRVHQAKWTGHALNAAIAAQVVFGALTTGISAATTGRKVRYTC